LGSVTEWPNRDWFRESREPRERSVSLDTRWEVVWPTTPLWNRGGISIESEEPRELELSRLTRLASLSSDGLLALFPDNSASAAMTCLGSVLLVVLCSSLEPRILLSLLSPALRCLLKGLYASLGATFIMTGTLSSPRPYLVLFLLVSLGSCFLVRVTFGTPNLDLIGEFEAEPGEDRASSSLR